jgi:hypothetical protein
MGLDHVRAEIEHMRVQVGKQRKVVSRSGYDEPYQIRRTLTENTVRASDRRAQFVGLAAYEQAGGTSCGICSHTTMAAGCRMCRCSIVSSPRS